MKGWVGVRLLDTAIRHTWTGSLSVTVQPPIFAKHSLCRVAKVMVSSQGAAALSFCVMQKQMIHFQQHRGVADDPALHHPLLLPHLLPQLLPQLLPHLLLPVVVPPDQHTTYWAGQHPLSVL